MLKKVIAEAEAAVDSSMGGNNAGFWKHVFAFHSL
jgi:hypothetical protein